MKFGVGVVPLFSLSGWRPLRRVGGTKRATDETDFLSDTDYGALLVRRTSIETYGNLLDEKAQFLVDAVREIVVRQIITGLRCFITEARNATSKCVLCSPDGATEMIQIKIVSLTSIVLTLRSGS
jgi:hypothetical protein